MPLLVSIELILAAIAALLFLGAMLAWILHRNKRPDYHLRRGENYTSTTAAFPIYERSQQQADTAALTQEQHRLADEVAAQQRAREAWQSQRENIADEIRRISEQATRASTEVERALARVRQEQAEMAQRYEALERTAETARLAAFIASPAQRLANSVQASYAQVAWAFAALARKLES